MMKSAGVGYRPMNPDLEQLLQSIDQAARGMSAEQLQWLPPDFRERNKWCVAQILEHLSLTYHGTAGLMRKVLIGGASMATTPSIRQRVGPFIVVALGYLRGGREAPAMVVPSAANADTVVREVHDNLAAMDKALSECERHFGGRAKVANHPVLGALTVGQ